MAGNPESPPRTTPCKRSVRLITAGALRNEPRILLLLPEASSQDHQILQFPVLLKCLFLATADIHPQSLDAVVDGRLIRCRHGCGEPLAFRVGSQPVDELTCRRPSLECRCFG